MEPWYQKLIAKHVREDKSLFACSNELDLGLTVKQCEALTTKADFASMLRGERFKYYKEIAQDPNRSKTAAIGSLLFLGDKLIEKGNYDKAANVILQVAKLEGWLEDHQTVNLFGNVTQADIVKMRDKVTKDKAKADLMN